MLSDAEGAYRRQVELARAKLAKLMGEAEQWAEGRRAAIDGQRADAYARIDEEFQRNRARAQQLFDAHMRRLNADRQAARARAKASRPTSTLPPLPSLALPEAIGHQAAAG